MRSEFQFIKNIKKTYDLKLVGDDCAVLPKDDETDLLVTADLLVQDVDFRLGWTTPEMLGHKTLAVSLSDIAAMGGTATHSTLSVGITDDLWDSDFLDRFYDGWHSLAGQYGVEMIGGDVSKSAIMVFDSVVLGEIPKGSSILRSGACPGDRVFVSGVLGGAAGGLRHLENQIFDSPLLPRQLKPTPQLPLAKLLRQLRVVTSMIDVSDGISSDLRHICDSSSVGARIDSSRLPVDPLLSNYYSRDQSIDLALNGGEDFELLFTVAENDSSRLAGLPVTEIGLITDDPGTFEILTDGVVAPLIAGGFEHF